MEIPQIQIRQQYGQIGIETTNGRLEINQPGPTIELKQSPPELHISRAKGGLEIDQDKAWDALGLGGNLEVMSRIYSTGPEMALRGLTRIVEDGNRMAAIHLKGNPFAEMAKGWQRSYMEFDFRGEASIDNVDVRYTPDQLSIEVNPGRVDLQVKINPPVFHHERAKVNIYLLKPPSLEIIPPQIDLSI